jgi:hypothetical protein
MKKISRVLWGTAGLLLCCSICVALAVDKGSRRYQLPDRSVIQLEVPGSWKDEVRQSRKNLPPTIIFRPPTGSSFMVLVTPIWPRKTGSPPASPEKIRQLVYQAAEHVKPQVVEKTIKVEKLQGPAGMGYFFSVTDRAPKPGEYKFMTQGIIRIGEVLTTFTILTNQGQASVVADALEMLKQARHEKGT